MFYFQLKYYSLGELKQEIEYNSGTGSIRAQVSKGTGKNAKQKRC